jgi:hypothetical protein
MAGLQGAALLGELALRLGQPRHRIHVQHTPSPTNVPVLNTAPGAEASSPEHPEHVAWRTGHPCGLARSELEKAPKCLGQTGHAGAGDHSDALGTR